MDSRRGGRWRRGDRGAKSGEELRQISQIQRIKELVSNLLTGFFGSETATYRYIRAQRDIVCFFSSTTISALQGQRPTTVHVQWWKAW